MYYKSNPILQCSNPQNINGMQHKTFPDRWQKHTLHLIIELLIHGFNRQFCPLNLKAFSTKQTHLIIFNSIYPSLHLNSSLNQETIMYLSNILQRTQKWQKILVSLTSKKMNKLETDQNRETRNLMFEIGHQPRLTNYLMVEQTLEKIKGHISETMRSMMCRSNGGVNQK